MKHFSFGISDFWILFLNPFLWESSIESSKSKDVVCEWHGFDLIFLILFPHKLMMLIGILGTCKLSLMPLTPRSRDALLQWWKRCSSRSSLILVNIVDIGLQFDALCFRYFLRRCQIRLFLKIIDSSSDSFSHEKISGPIWSVFEHGTEFIYILVPVPFSDQWISC